MPKEKHYPSQKSKKPPLLIIDKEGELAVFLIKKFEAEFLPVVVSRQRLEGFGKQSIFIPLRRNVTKIPENFFPYIFFVDTDDGFVRSLLPSLIKYTDKNRAVLSVITTVFLPRIKNIRELAGDPNIQVYVTGDVFGLKNNKTSPVEKVIAQGKKGRLLLASQGLSEYYPVSLEEVARLIAENHAVSPSAKPFLLFPRHPFTGLSLAREVLRYFPSSKLDISTKKENIKPRWFPQEGVFLTQRSIRDQLAGVVGKKDIPEDIDEKKTRSLFPVFASLGFFVALFFFLPLVGLLGLAASGGVLTQLSISSFEKGEVSRAKDLSEQAAYSFELSDSIATSYLPLAEALGRGKTIGSYSKKMNAAIGVNSSIVDIAVAYELFNKSREEKDQIKARSDLVGSLNRLNQGFLTLRSLDAEGQIPTGYRDKLQKYQELGDYFLTVKEALPQVLGYDREKKYLILFQNNNELRPGGGFIGSFAIARVKNGNLVDLKIHDVYDADGQLSARVEPPYPLKEHMGVENWFLRDSNFAVDFLENAARAAFFLRLEMGQEVDGVIAMDTHLISSLLEKTGPLEIADYGESVTGDNFSELLQSEIEDDFFPGSQKKRELLNEVYDSLMQRFAGDKGDLPAATILETAVSALKEKHLMLAFADQALQSPFTLANMSGSIWDGREEEESTINDYLGIVEANLGENKVNPYIERHIAQSVVLAPEELRSVVTVTYKNESSSSDRFGGVYKNYLRFVFPFAANATEIKVDGVRKTLLPALPGEATREERERVSEEVVSVDTGEEKGKKTLGLLFEVPPGQTRKLELTLVTQTDFTTQDPDLKYSLFLFKQPGRGDDPYSLKFTFPKSYRIVSATDNLKTTPDTASGLFLLEEDKLFEIELGQK